MLYRPPVSLVLECHPSPTALHVPEAVPSRPIEGLTPTLLHAIRPI